MRFSERAFFFDRTKPDRNNASKIVTTICRQIATTIPEIKADICSSISKCPSVGTQSLNNQWEYLVLTPLQMFGKRMLVPLTLITVIDALDECEGEADLAAFLQLIAQAPALTSIHLKFFITSRPEAHVRSDFRDMAGVSIFEDELHKVALLPNILTADYKDDITRYLEHEITKLTPTKCIDDWPGKSRINELARKSDGLFIHAATACLFLGGAKGQEDRLDMRLNMIFDDRVADGSPQKSLDGIYTRILRYSVIGGAIDEEKELICRRFRLMVGSIVILFEPLTTAALGYLLGQPVSQVKDTLGELYSVLAMGDEQLPIQLLHLSFRDFLLNPARCIDRGFLVSEKETHTALFRHCLGVLKVVLRKNICNLPSFGVRAADVTPITLHQHLPEGAQYACRYWPDHLQRAGLEPADEDAVYSFLKTHLLHWFEALSLMHKFSDGIVAVLKLSDYISALPGPPRIALVGILHDAKRFMRRFNLVIEAAPLQVYSSALMHSPERSVIRQHFQGEIPNWIKRAPEAKLEWDPLLQTLHDTLRPKDLALSPDGKRVASSNLCIWDTETGTLLRDFDPLGDGHRVAFSPDGQFVMSISIPGHVRVWNLASGLLVQEVVSSLENPFADTPSIPLHVFSPDRTIAVIALYALKFEVIDVRNGTSLRIIEGPDDELLRHIALSNDGVFLASGSTDGCVRLWDVRTGILQHEFAGHLDAICRVVFSSDDKLLASVSDDKTVKVWDLVKGEQLAELSGQFLDLAFLDGAILMCSQPDHSNIQLWDVISNEQATLHGPYCQGLRLSPDGTLVTSVPFTGVDEATRPGPTVAVWSLRTGKLVHLLEGHSDDINNSIFSADNKLLASASEDGTIRLWDLSAQANSERLDGHSESVCIIIVSPDLRVAASRARHDRIRLWDVDTGSLRQTFEGDFTADPFFSPDGKSFLVPLGKEVQVWSIATGELTRCINCYSNDVVYSAFSPDGSLLALKYANAKLCLAKDRTLGGTVDAGNDTGVDGDELRLFGCGEPHFITSTIMPPAVGIWNWATGALLQVAKGTSEAPGCLAFSPNGRFLAFGPHHESVKRIQSGGWIAIWDVPNGLLSVVGNFVKRVIAISWSPDGNALASIIDDDTWERHIQVWDMATRSLNTLITPETGPYLTAFSPDGQLLLSASYGGIYQLWEARTGTMIGQRESLWKAQRLRFSEDANMIDTGPNRLELASFYPGWVPTDSTEFFLTGNWVRQGQLALLLPNDDRPRCAATAGGVLIIGHESGRVTFLQLGEE